MVNKKLYYIERSAAFLAAIILLQTLYFKFTGHPDSIHIFTKIGGEPYLRIGSGIVELIISLLLIYRKTSLLGAMLGIGVMLGAVGQHLFVLGIAVNDDGGTLFVLALTTLICCVLIVWLKRKDLRRLIYRK